jgi:sulfatase modifying factor 1
MANQVKSSQINHIKFKMIHCDPGTFMMGSNQGNDNEKPKHEVKLNQGFWIGETQVTQELWQAVMGYNDSYFNDHLFEHHDHLPVEMVNWYECIIFCNQLSILENLNPCFKIYDIEMDEGEIIMATVEWDRNANGYRLPTEAEWEYAAKAGTEYTYSGSNHLEEVAWTEHNSGSHTHKVKKKKPNSWGLYDMSGNVWEWCLDLFDIKRYQSETLEKEDPILWTDQHCRRLLRGGSAWYLADDCRVSVRLSMEAHEKLCIMGLRLVRSA